MRHCPFCKTEIPAHLFACRKHWFDLTPAEREEVQAAYQDWKAGDSAEELRRRQQVVIDSAGPRLAEREREWRSASGISAKNADAPATHSQCRACKAPIFFATTEEGRTIPMDANPVADGNMFRDGDTMKAVSLLNQPPAGAVLYKSHFATCTDPKRFRR